MSQYTPIQLASLIQNLSVVEAHGFWRTIDRPLTADHARELLSVARGLTQWHRIMAVLMIGDFCFDNEFVDYAIDVLMEPRWGQPPNEDPWALLASGEDPFAVGLWAYNLLISRRAISPEQYHGISRLPDETRGKQALLNGLRTRVT